jgi:RNA polymerase sigma-70 factor, ECF subfamily
LVSSTPGTGSFKTLFEACFDAYYEPLHRYAYTLLREQELASDVVQNTFVKWWEAQTRLENADEARRYLYTGVYRNALNVLRNRKTQAAAAIEIRRTLSAPSMAHDGMIATELDEKINRLVEGLPPQCRVIFCKSRLEGKKYAAIAEELQLSIKTVESQMGKALRVLRENLAEYIDG